MAVCLALELSFSPSSTDAADRLEEFKRTRGLLNG